MTGVSYEGVKARLDDLRAAAGSREREITWLDEPANTVGLARNEQQRVEVFLAGPELTCRSPLVAAAIETRVWQRSEDGTSVKASRLVLPSEKHFDAVAAFVCTHLLDCGFADDRQAAFTLAEPVIELALEANRLSNQALLGLLGELLCLRAMVSVVPDRAFELMRAWDGHARATRDFQLGGVGLEVKTTTGLESQHHLAGVRQAEVGHPNSDTAETAYYLMSLGLERVPEGEANEDDVTLPGLVDELLAVLEELLGDTEAGVSARRELLEKVQNYGSHAGVAYEHEAMRDRVIYQQSWRERFARCYDMSDAAIALPRSADLVGFVDLDIDSLAFSVTLRPKVRGDLNPRIGLNPALTHVLHLAWGYGAPS